MSLPYEHCSPSRACQLLQMKCHLSALHTGGTWPFMSMRWMSWQAWQLQLFWTSVCIALMSFPRLWRMPSASCTSSVGPFLSLLTDQSLITLLILLAL